MQKYIQYHTPLLTIAAVVKHGCALIGTPQLQRRVLDLVRAARWASLADGSPRVCRRHLWHLLDSAALGSKVAGEVACRRDGNAVEKQIWQRERGYEAGGCKADLLLHSRPQQSHFTTCLGDVIDRLPQASQNWTAIFVSLQSTVHLLRRCVSASLKSHTRQTFPAGRSLPARHNSITLNLLTYGKDYFQRHLRDILRTGSVYGISENMEDLLRGGHGGDKQLLPTSIYTPDI